MKTVHNIILKINGLKPSKKPAVTMKAVLFTLQYDVIKFLKIKIGFQKWSQMDRKHEPRFICNNFLALKLELVDKD